MDLKNVLRHLGENYSEEIKTIKSQLIQSANHILSAADESVKISQNFKQRIIRDYRNQALQSIIDVLQQEIQLTDESSESNVHKKQALTAIQKTLTKQIEQTTKKSS